MHLQQVEGLKLGSVVLDTGRGFVTGMAAVCQELLQLLACDVVLLGVVHTNAKGQPFLSLIGRCSARAEGQAVNLNTVLSRWQGGGHPAAAAASVKLESQAPKVGKEAAAEAAAAEAAAAEAEATDGEGGGEGGGEVVETAAVLEARSVLAVAMSHVIEQIPEQITAVDLMTTSVHSCSPTDTMVEIRATMNRLRKRALPVLDEDETLLGYVKYRDPVRAVQTGKGQQQAKAWMRRELLKVESDTPFNELEALLLEGSTGRLHVVDADGKLIGLISRTDILRHHKLYVDMTRRGS